MFLQVCLARFTLEDRIHNRIKRGWSEQDAVMLPLAAGVKYKNRRGVCPENTKEET